MPSAPGSVDYDALRDTYAEELDDALAFAGRDHAFFARAKAQELLALAERRLGDTRRLDALDLGSGPGLTDAFLQGRVRSLTGIDVSRAMVERAAETNPWARYVHYDGSRLPFEDGRFDLAFTICVIQVVPRAQRPALAAELARVVRPGGLVAAFEHNPLNPLTRLVVRRCSFAGDAEMLRRRQLEELLRGAGLRVVEAGHMLVFPSRRQRLLALERRLSRLPLGAQHYVAAERG